MPDVLVEVGGRDAPLDVRINGNNPTFILKHDEIERSAMREMPTQLLDLLDIAAAVFAADGAIGRGGATRPAMGQAWRRRMTFEIPVRSPDLWARPAVANALRDAAAFLTEDLVDFRFLQSDEPDTRQAFLDLYGEKPPFEADEVILFSGGLDSFAGALETLATSSARVILVFHRSAQKAIPRQVDLGHFLAKKFPGRVLHIHVLARRKGQEAADTNQRSRSFLFAALGFSVAIIFGAARVSFFENGIVSHNLPLSTQIVGTMATRTTHPLALHKLNALLQEIVPRGPAITNKYQWNTKSEVVARIAQHGGSSHIRRAVSCTSLRDQDSLRTHCGACSQCLDRRFGLLAAGLATHDPDEIYRTDVLFGMRDSTHSRTLALDWVRSMLRFSDLDTNALLDVHALEVMRIIRGHPELEKATALDMTLSMHQRQADVVRLVLEDAIRTASPRLVDGSLSASSLLRLHVASGHSDHLADDPRADIETPSVSRTIEEVDVVPMPDDPLEVQFGIESGRPFVAITGICRITGQIAKVPHGLKVQFDEDRRNQLPADQCAYVLATRIPGLQDAGKGAVRAVVKRCRDEVAEGYERLHGMPPGKHLLIQNKPSRGYRLDPEILLICSGTAS